MSRISYTDEEHRALASAYLGMAIKQAAGVKFSKAALVRELRAGPLSARSRGAVEAKFMNMSAIAVQNNLFPELDDGYVKGYKPAPNAAKSLLGFLKAAIVSHIMAERAA